MARTKYSEHFCGHCNKDTKMVTVGTMEGLQAKTWYRCTRCHHMSLLETPLEKSCAKIDATTATPYNPLQSFKIGEAIFHNDLNDVGKVMSKVRTSDGSQAIIVSFEKLGQRRLIENSKPEAQVELAQTE